MKRQTIGRNEPCSCGSGKKYKKCCYGKTTDTKSREQNILPPYDEIDYGKPILDENFFNFNTAHEISASRLLYSTLLMPDVEKVAEQVSRKFIERCKDEWETIERIKDANELINIMAQSPDPLNYLKLIDKLLQLKEESIPLIIKELKKTKDDAFVEIAVKVIYRSGEDYSGEILEIIKFHQKDAYVISLLCMLLGFYENKESEKVLWNYFHFFREYFKHETFSDGPLLGLTEMRERRKEKWKRIHI